MGINDKIYNKSNKLRKITPLKNYIVDKIDENQNIKRLCRYLTKAPLEQISYDLNGKIVTQNDLNNSLKFITDEVNTCKNKIIIPFMFNDNQENMDEQVFIFVHGYSNDFNDTTGKNIFMIDILCPIVYNELDTYGSERIYEIAAEIIGIFDEEYVEEEYHELIGCYQFFINGKGNEWRVSNNNNVVAYSFPISVNIVNSKVMG